MSSAPDAAVAVLFVRGHTDLACVIAFVLPWCIGVLSYDMDGQTYYVNGILSRLSKGEDGAQQDIDGKCSVHLNFVC